MKKIPSILLIFLIVTAAFAQNPTDVLMTIDGEPVFVNEFERVYNKNLDLVKDESQRTIDGYLDLFVDYKLKVAEAYRQNLNQNRTYQREFQKYRSQLARSYLKETALLEEIAKEAYKRGEEQINANHILITVGYDAVPKDTLSAYTKIKNLREKALAGEDFVSLAKQNSEEPGAKTRGGDLGYFTAFSMVYPFETMAYNTKVGEISEIVRTSYGYHIIKVNERRLLEQPVVVSHIMIAEKKDDPSFKPEERINELYKMLQQGSDFSDLAKQFSDDKNSGKLGGKLKAFSKGQLRSSAFENVAYDLKNIGDLSKPVKTRFGWHVLKLEGKEKALSFEEQKESLYKKVKNGDRSKRVSTQVLQDIIDKYGIERMDYLDFFDTYISEEVLVGKWQITDTLSGDRNKVLLKIGKKDVMYSELAKYIVNKQRFAVSKSIKREFIRSMYKEFEAVEIKDFLNEQLESENPEFAAIISEYRDGLLIFDVMQKNVWQKAKQDSVGLQNYYEKVSENYTWGTRINAEILSGGDSAKIAEAKAMLEAGNDSGTIKKKLNTNGNVFIIITDGLYEKDDAALPQSLDFEKGVSPVLSNGKTYSVVHINEVLEPSVKMFDEAKGRVMSEYQNKVEEDWVNSLRAKYEVVIKKKPLKKLKKRFN
jgi:peptidyl-prolyl cis-trans isomerase SurA